MAEALYFILLLCGLIFFHELGHYLAARWMGVHVVTFSIGFGPKLFGWSRKSAPDGLKPTEYVVAAIPLGGYVKMLGDDPSEESSAYEREVAFQHKPVWRRLIIVSAGPAFNLLLPFIIFFFIFMGSDKLASSTVGMVIPDGPAAAAGMPSGARITHIGEQDISYWYQVLEEISSRPGEKVSITWEHRGQSTTRDITPLVESDRRRASVGLDTKVGRIGVRSAFIQPVIAVKPQSAAAIAGLKQWDRVVAAQDGAVDAMERIERLDQLEAVLEEHAARPITLYVLRHKDMTEAGVRMGLGALQKVVLPASPERPLRGIFSAEFVISSVTPASPADTIGLKPGDRVTELCTRSTEGLPLECRSFADWNGFWRHLATQTESMRLKWVQPDGVSREADFTLAEVPAPTDLTPDNKIRVFGAATLGALGTPPLIDNDHRLGYALHRSWTDSIDAIVINTAAIGGLLSGQVPLKELGGPIRIGQLAAKTTELGPSYFFHLMIWLSVSLGLINLLPIPILDGGHIVFLTIEAIRRRPVSLRTRQIATYVGLAFILVLMVLVFKNDIERAFFA